MSNKDERLRALLGRRDFLKIAIVSGSAIVTAGLIKLLDSESIDSVLATSGTGPYYYGTDTSWAVDTKGSNASNFPQNFYIGRTGVETVIYNDSAFYSVAADKAGKSYTHTYWLVKGPYYKYRGSRTPYNYGHDQGAKAAYAWSHHYWSSKIGGKTIFADIERGKSDDPQSDLFDGWRYFVNGNEYVNIANNRAVLEGFLDGINDYGSGFNPGIYTRTDLWQSWFGGTNYDPQRPYVVWLAGNACGFSCSPCGTCTTAKSEANSKFNTKKETAFGKYKTVIWQFFISECPAPDCADYDIARQNGYIRFAPIYSMYLPLILKNGSGNMGALNAYPAPNQDSSSTENIPSSGDSTSVYPAPDPDQ
jgi:hypothetical protein